jgi:excisionase family DNA binding protein
MINFKVGEEGRMNNQESRSGNGGSEPSCPLWTVDDVSSYLKLQPETIRSMARRGELPAVKFGKVWRFEKTAIDDLLVSRG